MTGLKIPWNPPSPSPQNKTAKINYLQLVTPLRITCMFLCTPFLKLKRLEVKNMNQSSSLEDVLESLELLELLVESEVDDEADDDDELEDEDEDDDEDDEDDDEEEEEELSDVLSTFFCL